METYVIADIGACHDGEATKMDLAIMAAADAGADAIKFQWTSRPYRMARRRGRALEDGYGDVYARYLAWPSDWHAGLAGQCRDAGIDYMCTAFLPEDVATVAPHVASFKVASFEADDAALLEAHVPFRRKRVIVSTGMLDDRGAASVAGLARAFGLDAPLLHCVSAYPCPHGELGLAIMRHGRYAGLSDHTRPELTWTGALAAAAGARIVEAHLRLDGTDAANPDFPHAMAPGQFGDYVRNIRFAEACVGDGRRASACEDAMRRYRVGT